MKSKKLLRRPYRDITGDSFGILTGLRPTLRTVKGLTVWKCRCRCGKVVRVAHYDLRKGTVKDCGTNCWPSQQYKKTIARLEMYEKANEEKRQEKYKENAIRWAKEKKEKQKKQEVVIGGNFFDDDDYVAF